MERFTLRNSLHQEAQRLHGHRSSTEIHKDWIIVIFAHKLALYLVSFPESLEQLYVLNNSFHFYTSGGASAVSTEIAKP